MKSEDPCLKGLISAMFAYEFLDGGVDYDTIEQIHRGEIDDWLVALDRSGLFDEFVMTEIRDRWMRSPKVLFDILLGDADEMTIRRCTTTWAALDRIAPLADIG